MTIRCLAVGWDGADRECVGAMLAAGELPNLGRLAERGRWGRIAELPGLGDDGHWATFSTGVNPGEHGRFHYLQTVPGAPAPSVFRRVDMDTAPFWEPLIREGRRVAAVDVPKSPMAAVDDDRSASRQLVDWMPHGEDHGVPTSVPPDLADTVRSRYPDPDLPSCHRVHDDAGVQELIRRVGQRLDAREDLLRAWAGDGDWDLFLAVFAESHCIGHHAWHLHEPADGQAAADDPVRAAYRALDAALGDLVAAAGDGADVLVFAPLGMGRSAGAIRSLPELLARLDAEASLTTSRVRRGFRRLRRLADPPPAVRASCVPHDSMSTAVRLHVEGRDPGGTVPQGAGYRRVLDELEHELMQLTDAASGRPAVRAVVRTADVFPGPRSTALADLLVLWDAAHDIGAVSSPRFGMLDPGPPPPGRGGNHRPGGWFVLAGPGADAMPAADEAALTDLAPAIASMVRSPRAATGARVGVAAC